MKEELIKFVNEIMSNKIYHNLENKDIVDTYLKTIKEQKNICPFCESNNTFSFWMHHFKCKNCNTNYDK